MVDFIESLDSVTHSIDELNESQNVLSEAMSNVSAVAEESSATSEEVASLYRAKKALAVSWLIYHRDWRMYRMT